MYIGAWAVVDARVERQVWDDLVSQNLPIVAPEGVSVDTEHEAMGPGRSHDYELLLKGGRRLRDGDSPQ